MKSTYTFKPGVSSDVYSLIIVELLPPAPAALVDNGFSFPSFSAAALRLFVTIGMQILAYTSLILFAS